MYSVTRNRAPLRRAASNTLYIKCRKPASNGQQLRNTRRTEKGGQSEWGDPMGSAPPPGGSTSQGYRIGIPGADRERAIEQWAALVCNHRLTADEPVGSGGTDRGPPSMAMVRLCAPGRRAWKRHYFKGPPGCESQKS